MPYYLSLMATQGVLRLRYYGKVDVKERLQALDQILRMCQDQHIARLLVDFTEQESPSIALDAWTLFSTLSEAGLPHCLKIAFLCSTGGFPSGVPHRTILDIEMAPEVPFSTVRMRRRAVAFRSLTDEHVAQLKYFLDHGTRPDCHSHDPAQTR